MGSLTLHSNAFLSQAAWGGRVVGFAAMAPKKRVSGQGAGQSALKFARLNSSSNIADLDATAAVTKKVTTWLLASIMNFAFCVSGLFHDLCMGNVF